MLMQLCTFSDCMKCVHSVATLLVQCVDARVCVYWCACVYVYTVISHIVFSPIFLLQQQNTATQTMNKNTSAISDEIPTITSSPPFLALVDL